MSSKDFDLRLIPGGSSTRSRQPIEGIPSHMVDAAGAHLKLSDGQWYLDFRGAQGTNILGYGVLERSSPRLKEVFRAGPTHSTSCIEELEMAELLLSHFTGHEQVRFFKTGADACSAAVRLSRIYTGREKIISCGYHGWHDQWSTGLEAERRNVQPNLGVPGVLRDLIYEIPYGDIEGLHLACDQIGHNLACIITVPLDWDLEPNCAFIQECKRAATRLRCPLILDDVFSGFRLHMRGGEGFFSVNADLVCLSKAIANGYPLAAVVGHRDIMSSAVRTSMSSTYSTDRLSLTAGIETMKRIFLLDPPLLDHFNELFRAVEAEIDSYLGHFSRDMVFFGQPAAPRFKFANSLISPIAIAREAVKRGVLFNGTYLFTHSHNAEDAIRGARVASEVIADLMQRRGEGCH